MSAFISNAGQIAARLISDVADARPSSSIVSKAAVGDASSSKIITITISSSAQKGVAASSAGHPPVSAESIARYAETFPPREG